MMTLVVRGAAVVLAGALVVRTDVVFAGALVVRTAVVFAGALVVRTAVVFAGALVVRTASVLACSLVETASVLFCRDVVWAVSAVTVAVCSVCTSVVSEGAGTVVCWGRSVS